LKSSKLNLKHALNNYGAAYCGTQSSSFLDEETFFSLKQIC